MMVCLLFMLCWLQGLTAFAGTGGGSETRANGQTEVLAGVVVDYMGKLRFEVKDEKTLNPIPGASVELWIPGINGEEGAYVLFGVTDENGVLELDVAYQTGGKENQFVTTDGKLTFGGSLLYLSGNHLKYQVYKAGWLPYPKQGEVTLELKEVPQVITVLLHKPESSGGGDDDGGGGDGGSSHGGNGGSDSTQIITEDEVALSDRPVVPPIEPIPKTGVENHSLFWGAALLFFAAAAGVMGLILFMEKRKNRKGKGGRV